MNQLTGIDVYHGDRITDWDRLKRSIDFMYIKATEGDNFSDAKYKWHRDNAQRVGIPCGSYHFYRSNKDPNEQAKDFIAMVNDLRVGELFPILDWETDDDPKDGPDIGEAQIFLDILEKRYGHVPFIYGGYYFLKDKKLPASFVKYPLIVPRYGKPAMIPSPWTKLTIWQDNDKAPVSGIANRCDHNIFYGTLEDLKGYMKK